MQDNRIDGGALGARLGVAVPNPSRVRGLGLCDVLRVELEPCQIAGAIDELEERRGPLNEAFEQARTRWDALAEQESQRPTERTLQHEPSRSAYALRLLSMLRAQLPAIGHGEPVAIVGPASSISGLIAAAARNAVDELSELIREPQRSDGQSETRLRAAMAATSAWLETYIDCEALEWFTFDPPYDPDPSDPKLWECAAGATPHRSD
jgi:hypothetical protein